MARLCRQAEVCQLGDFRGHDVNDSLIVLNFAGDDESGFLKPSLLFVEKTQRF
jgi:hypothetical protein